MRQGYILALDQGTTSSRALLFDRAGRVLGQAQRRVSLRHPRPGWVEADGEDLVESQRQAALACLNEAGVSPAAVCALGIANQRETTLLWERGSGRLVAPAIIWQCRRSTAIAQRWRGLGLESRVRKLTGLTLDPYFSATKLAWLLETGPDLRRMAEAGDLAFGTVDTFLVYRLTAGKSHLTDVSNASRTAFFDLETLAWDDELLAAMGIPRALLPRVVDSSGALAVSDTAWFGQELAVASMIGDQQAALFGQQCHAPGLAKCTLGTGAFVLGYGGERPGPVAEGLIRTVAWRRQGEAAIYAWEGSTFTAGALLEWLSHELGLLARPQDADQMATSVADTADLVVVPAFSGLGSPYWDASARGLWIGLTAATTRQHVVRAALEAIAFQVADVVRSMAAGAGHAFNELRIDGGVGQSNFLAQFLADILALPVVRPRMPEATARGAAFLAGLARGLWRDLDQLPSPEAGERFVPRMRFDEAERRYLRWRTAVARARGWAPNGEEEC